MSREDDILIVAKAIIDCGVSGSNGDMVLFWCPFCNSEQYDGPEFPYPELKDIRHKLDCPYLVAKDLLAKR